jgi:hypothetical protein
MIDLAPSPLLFRGHQSWSGCRGTFASRGYLSHILIPKWQAALPLQSAILVCSIHQTQASECAWDHSVTVCRFCLYKIYEYLSAFSVPTVLHSCHYLGAQTHVRALSDYLHWLYAYLCAQYNHMLAINVDTPGPNPPSPQSSELFCKLQYISKKVHS